MTPHPEQEDALERFFAAARSAEEAPRTALLSAILADAAEVHATRNASAPASRRTARGIRLFAPIGGWRGLAALGACAALGFWLGLAGNLSLDGATLTAGVASPSTAEGVDAFFDYASVEQ